MRSKKIAYQSWIAVLLLAFLLAITNYRFLITTWIVNINSLRLLRSPQSVNVNELESMNNPRADILLAFLTFQSHDYLTSEWLYQRAIQFPYRAEIAYWRLSQIYLAQQEREKAIEYARLAGGGIQYQLDCARQARQVIASQRESVEDAIETCELALESTQSDINIATHLAGLYNILGDAEKAKEFYFRASKVETDTYNRQVELGHALQIAQDWNEAIAAYQRAVAINPHQAGPFFEMGIIYYLKLNQLEAAREAFKRAVTISPNEPEFNYWLGKVDYDLGDIGSACRLGSRAVELADSHVPYLIFWGDCTFAEKKYSIAKSIYQKVLSLEPNNQRALAQIREIDSLEPNPH